MKNRRLTKIMTVIILFCTSVIFADSSLTIYNQNFAIVREPINLNLKKAYLRVGRIEEASLVHLRYLHQGDIYRGSDINKVGMAYVMPAGPPDFMREEICHGINIEISENMVLHD